MIKLFLLFLMPFMLFGIDINEQTQKIQVLSESSIWIDYNNTLTHEAVLTKNFQSSSTNTLTFGYAPHRSVWIKFTLHNTSSAPITKILSYEHPITQSITFYDDNNLRKSGFWHREKNKQYFLPSFEVKLQAHEEKTFYIKAHSEYTTLITKLILWDAKFLTKRDNNIFYLILIFLSIILTLLIYNLIIYFFTKEKAYLYYIFYLLAMLLAHSTRSGILSYFLLLDEVTIFLSHCISVIHALFIVSIVLFTREFLNTYNYPKIDKALKFYLYYISITAILTCYHFIFDMRIMITYLPLVLLLLFTGAFSYYKGKKEAIFYLIGWSVLLLAILSTPLRSLGLFNITDYIVYPYTIAFIVEAFFFSFALAYKIKTLNQNNQDKQQHIISLQKEEQTRLKKLVDEKTKNISSLLNQKELLFQELNHRVKNNLQMILSLVKLQIGTSTSTQTKEALSVTKNRIDSFTALYENLHLQEEMHTFDTEEHFRSIIKNIMTDEHKHITAHYSITHNLKESALLYAGLIVNELATNAFKYAFEASGTLSISLKKEDKHITLNVVDNGVGFEETKEESLGLTIVQTLVEKQLYGNINIESNNGTKITIKWEEQ